MFKKAVVISRCVKPSVRSSRLLSTQKYSYLHNPGSEPLVNATLGEVIQETADRYPGRVAVRSVFEDKTITYEELLIKADKLGCGLRAQGLVKGDRVGIWSHNTADYIIAMTAAARAGLISVLINPVYEKTELSFCIKKAGLKALLLGPQLPKRDYYGTLRSLIPELQETKGGVLKSDLFPTLTAVISSHPEKLLGVQSFQSVLEESSGSQMSQYGSEVKPADGSIIHFTSGTTGDPKAALDSHLGVVNNTYFVGKRLMYDQGNQKICAQSPLFHAIGSVVAVMGGFRHGATIVLPAPVYDVKKNMNGILSEQCTVVLGTPTMFVDLLSAAQQMGDLPSKLEAALAAGAPCSPQLIRSVQEKLKARAVLALYGMTEATASIFQSLPTDSIDMVADTVGYIQDHVEVKVIDRDGKSVPFGSAGELVSRAYSNMICYWDEPEKTRSTIDEDGWLHTGDEFTISEDGYGRIVGRLKDIIVRGGENIAPKEIEDELNTNSDIIESQVVGVPDERLGEELCAVLRIRDGASVSVQDVSKHLSGKIAKFKIPRLVKVIDEFPKTASGKIQKFKVRKLIEEGKL